MREVPAGMATTTFGETLKREREMRGVSLEEISVATRIGTRFLQALESEQWDRLPGGVFNRGFVRAVGRYLGLNEEGLLAEYALAVNERKDPPVWAAPESLEVARPNWTTWILAVVVLVLLAAGAWATWRHFAKKRAAAKEKVAVAVQLMEAPRRHEIT